MRLARRLIVTAAVLGAIFIGANIVAENFAEDRLAEAAQQTLNTTTRPSVELDFPVLLNLLEGKLPRVVLVGRNAKLDDLTVAGVRIVLEGVRDPFNAVTQSTPLHVEGGSVNAEVEQKALNDLLARRGQDARVELRNNVVVVTGKVGTCPVRAEGLPKLEKDNLVFRPSKTPTTTCRTTGSALERQALQKAATFSVELPKLPGGVAIGRIEIRAGSLVLIATLKDAVIDLG